MIKSFRNEAARAAWERRFIKGWSRDILEIGNRKLTQIHYARSSSRFASTARKSARGALGRQERTAQHQDQ
jgi:hypothetical protein